MEVLQAVERQHENPFVIYGAKRGSHLVNLSKCWQRIRKEAGLEDVRLHDLRHSFASVGAAGGLGLPIIGALLGHEHATTTAKYSHLAADPLREANEAIGAHIAAAMNGANAEVVPLRKSKA